MVLGDQKETHTTTGFLVIWDIAVGKDRTLQGMARSLHHRVGNAWEVVFTPKTPAEQGGGWGRFFGVCPGLLPARPLDAGVSW